MEMQVRTVGNGESESETVDDVEIGDEVVDGRSWSVEVGGGGNDVEMQVLTVGNEERESETVGDEVVDKGQVNEDLGGEVVLVVVFGGSDGAPIGWR